MRELFVLTLLGFIMFVGCGLFIESIVLMEEIEFALWYSSLTAPIILLWAGLLVTIWGGRQ